MEQDTLSDRRRALGLSQTELASLLGISQAAVSRAENSNSADLRYALALEALERRHAEQAAA
jgi:transcriptional regulator with XRE-family HTH domain